MHASESAEMQIARALRLESSASPPFLPGKNVDDGIIVAFVGAGGKTTAIFQLARELKSAARNIHRKIIITATSHLGVWQIPLADHHLVIESPDDIDELPDDVTLITGAIDGDRTLPINTITLSWLREYSKQRNIPLLIEADGSRGRPLKAPADHEPPIPDFVNTVIVVAGLSALGKPLTEDSVFRAELFKQLSTSLLSQPDNQVVGQAKQQSGQQLVTSDLLVNVLIHPKGGLKNIPPRARRVLLLNQAESPELQSVGGSMAMSLLGNFDSVLVGSLHENEFKTFEQTAGVILAAGESTRFGTPKQLLDWKGKTFIRQVAETALNAGLQPVIVILGFCGQEVEAGLSGLPVNVIHNENWKSGQASSIVKGVFSLPPKAGSVIFLLADQPQIPADVIRALIDSHTHNLPSILAPLVQGEKRANPVLFDRVTFPDLLALTGDIGGRAIFDKHHVEYLPWHEDIILLDVDTPEDYRRLCGL
jgi:molybdenum cofactor cytidylyltransferase